MPPLEIDVEIAEYVLLGGLRQHFLLGRHVSCGVAGRDGASSAVSAACGAVGDVLIAENEAVLDFVDGDAAFFPLVDGEFAGVASFDHAFARELGFVLVLASGFEREWVAVGGVRQFSFERFDEDAGEVGGVSHFVVAGDEIGQFALRDDVGDAVHDALVIRRQSDDTEAAGQFVVLGFFVEDGFFLHRFDVHVNDEGGFRGEGAGFRDGAELCRFAADHVASAFLVVQFDGVFLKLAADVDFRRALGRGLEGGSGIAGEIRGDGDRFAREQFD